MKRQMYFLVLIIALLSCREEITTTKEAKNKVIPVQVYNAKRMEIFEKVSAKCTIRSRKRIKVSALVPGKIVKLFVDEGDIVEKDKTRLFKIDSTVIEKNLEALLLEKEVAEKGKAQAESAFKAALTAEKKAEKDFERMKRLFEKDKSITKDMLEKAKVGLEKAKANLKNAEIGIIIANKRINQVEKKISAAKKNLSDCTVYANVNGRVTAKIMEEGEFASPGRPVLIIEDYSSIEAASFFEQELYSRIIKGKTEANIIKNKKTIYKNKVSYKSPRIMDGLRVFEVRVYLPESIKGLNIGELAEMELILDKKQTVAVPALALIPKRNKFSVFVVKNNKAEERIIEKGIEGDGFVEIRKGVKEGENVVILGQTFLENGDLVKIVKGEK